ncbi:hypothetical protein AMK19_25380 [Kitasatospora sp. CB01950]|nr:hypothetical protein AMK19_25380 [Kitasatospora sp. CB01950]
MLGTHDSLAGGHPDRHGRAGICGQGLGSPPGCLQGQGIGRVGCDLAATNGGDDLARVDGRDRCVRCQGDERSQGEHLEVIRQRREQEVFGSSDVRERCRGRGHEPVGAITPHHLGRGEPIGAPSEDLQEQCGQIRPGQPLGQQVQQFRSTGLGQYSSQRRIGRVFIARHGAPVSPGRHRRDHRFPRIAAGSTMDERDEAGTVDGPPTDLGRLDELEHHRQTGGAGAGAFGEPARYLPHMERVALLSSLAARGTDIVPRRLTELDVP